jgi:hypothetical protein
MSCMLPSLSRLRHILIWLSSPLHGFQVKSYYGVLRSRNGCSSHFHGKVFVRLEFLIESLSLFGVPL